MKFFNERPHTINCFNRSSERHPYDKNSQLLSFAVVNRCMLIFISSNFTKCPLKMSSVASIRKLVDDCLGLFTQSAYDAHIKLLDFASHFSRRSCLVRSSSPILLTIRGSLCPLTCCKGSSVDCDFCTRNVNTTIVRVLVHILFPSSWLCLLAWLASSLRLIGSWCRVGRAGGMRPRSCG